MTPANSTYDDRVSPWHDLARARQDARKGSHDAVPSIPNVKARPYLSILLTVSPLQRAVEASVLALYYTSLHRCLARSTILSTPLCHFHYHFPVTIRLSNLSSHWRRHSSCSFWPSSASSSPCPLLPCLFETAEPMSADQQRRPKRSSEDATKLTERESRAEPSATSLNDNNDFLGHLDGFARDAGVVIDQEMDGSIPWRRTHARSWQQG